MTVRIRFAVVLICISGVGLALAPIFGTPWPGVVLAGLSLVPLALETWMGRWNSTERQSISAMAEVLNKHSSMHLDAQERLEEHSQQINSLRNAASLRGTLGG